MDENFPSSPDKPALRAFFLARRNAVPIRERLEKSVAIRKVAIDFLRKTSGIVAFYLPMRGEADISDLANALPNRMFALPSLDDSGFPSFRLYEKEGEIMRINGFPAKDSCAPLCVPDVVLCPLVAFDDEGGRLGYGKGFYDRALVALPKATAIGVAFESQRYPFALPHEPHDVRLQAVMTECGYFLNRRRSA
ncbi:MAG: 5-formyltetrahydrofolate cyclo-ligase [Rickettsiales bacterium]